MPDEPIYITDPDLVRRIFERVEASRHDAGVATLPEGRDPDGFLVLVTSRNGAQLAPYWE